MISKKVVELGNWFTRRKKLKVKAENILLLFPHCIQWSKCQYNITSDLSNCKKCGRCKVKNLIDLAEKLGLQIAVASGGRQAVKRVKEESVKAVIAVACEKELCAGMISVFPKPVLGIVNLLPNGPCVDTDVNMKEVEAGIKELIEEI
ncbi:MAG: DUF116 domain-containing protein [Planctomycetota bacterium]|jgi:hypothetical protein